MVDPFGTSLAGFALFFPIYDSCDRTFAAIKVMRYFGRDIRLLYFKLEAQWIILNDIMSRRQGQLEKPIDPDDEQHNVTSAVKHQLIVLQTHFTECESILSNELESHGVSLASLDGPDSSSASSTQQLSTQQTNDSSQTNITTPDQVEGSQQSTRSDKEATVLLARVGKHSFSALMDKLSFRSRRSKKISTASTAQTHRGDHTLQAVATPESSTFRHSMPIDPLSAIAPITRRDPETRAVQKQTSTWSHIKWAHHSKERFSELVNEIRNVLDDLNDLVAIRPSTHPHNLLGLSNVTGEDNHTDNEIAAALARVHAALKSVNGAPGKPTHVFDLHLATLPQDNWTWAKEHPDLALRNVEGFLFMIQGSEAENDKEETTLVMVESMKRHDIDLTPSTQQSTSGELRSLDLLAQSVAEQYRYVGYVTTPKSLGDCHKVFIEREKWKRTRTLSDFIADGDFARSLAFRDVALLTRVILKSYLDLRQVRQTCNNARLESFVYYEDTASADTSDLFLRPYLSCGFGQKEIQRRLGATGSASAKNPNAAIIELGLVLFQIGANRKVEYPVYKSGDLSTATLDAKRKALRDLDNYISKRYGSQFANIVEVCLTSNAKNEMMSVNGCLTKLQEILDQEMARV